MFCVCRNCGKHYDENKSRAELKGYCTAQCLHEKAKAKGYKKPTKKWVTHKTEYEVLSTFNLVGSVYLKPIDMRYEELQEQLKKFKMIIKVDTTQFNLNFIKELEEEINNRNEVIRK